MLARLWKNRNSDSLLAEMQNGTDTLENHLAVSYTIRPYIPAIEKQIPT